MSIAFARARLLGTTVLAGVVSAALVGHAAAQTQGPPVSTTPGASSQTDAQTSATSSQTNAQTPAAQAGVAGSTSVSEVVVTGSRIRRPNLEANNPITVVDSRAVNLVGIPDVAQILERLPQVGIGNDASTTTNSVRNQGIETISLRNLGSNRTLTLIDGHRQVGGGVGSSAVDVNTINPTLIDRIDIVTGGSSAVYGADAVAGVVNFILKRNLEGVLYKAEYGDSEHGGGATKFVSVSVGHNFDDGRGNITLSADYNKIDPIFRYQRDYALSGLSGVPNPARSIDPTVVNVPAYIAIVGGRTNVYGSSDPTGSIIYYSPAVVTALKGAPAYTYTFTDDGSSAIPFNRGTVLVNNRGTPQTISTNCSGCLQSYLDALQTGEERKGVESTGRFEFLRDSGWIQNMEAYYEAKYYANTGWSQSNSGTFAGPSVVFDAAPRADAGLPSAGAAYPIRLDNAYIPANLKAVIAATPLTSLPTLPANAVGAGNKVFYITRIDNDFGDRIFKTNYAMGEGVAGIRGTFKNDWKFDVFLNYGETDSDVYDYDRSQVKFFQQIDAVVNPATGQIVCRSTLTNPNNGCIPINIFSQQHTPQQVAYSYGFTHEVDKITLANAQANLSGNLFQYRSPFNGESLPIAFAIGGEFRRETSDQNPDPRNQSGENFGNFSVRTRGAYSTREAYGEVNVPLVADMPFAKRIELDGSVRYQDFTSTGQDVSYGVNGDWAINDSFKLRGVFSKAVRAPNITELFANGSVGYVAIADPCDNNNVGLGLFPANRLANCKSLLGSLAVGPNGSYSFTQSPNTKPTATLGNPDLAPERAQTLTGGFVFTPRFLRGFSMTVDYYDIKIKGAIATLPIATIVNDCVDSPTLNNQFCAAVQRGPDGNISFASSRYFNVASFTAEGQDFGAAYQFRISEGTLTLNLTGNHTHTLLYYPVVNDPTTRQQGAGALNYDQPKWRATARATFDYRNFTVSLATEYIGAMNLNNQDKPLDYAYERIPEYWRHDVRFEYRWHGASFFTGVDNFTDAPPPFIPGVFTGTGTAAIYGPIGRFFYGGVSGRF